MIKRIIFFLLAGVIAAGCSSDTGQVRGPQTAGNIRFADATANSGVTFTQIAGRNDQKPIPEIMGSGTAVGDFNRDGAPDLLIVNSGALGAASRPQEAGDRLFLNDGKGVFRDATAEWNLTSDGYGQGVAVGDFDNDGWIDAFLTNFEGRNRLLRNTGTKFEDVTAAAGIKPDGRWATSAGFFDMDGDADLDLYVVKYVAFDPKSWQRSFRNRVMIYPTPTLYEGLPDQIWRNDGGKFTDVTAESGIAADKGKGLALGIVDIDLDGDQDIYVANDSTANNLWINDGKGKFKDVAAVAGCAYSITGREEGSMGVDFTDIDGNGRLDIAVTNFQDESTAVYSQTEPLLFREVSDAIGIGQASRARLKWGLEFFDADNDGDEDLISVNGHVEDNISINSDTITFEQTNSLFENTGDGKFAEITESAGQALADKQVSRGLATADLDGDGDLDYVVVNNGGKVQVAFNETAKKGNFVGLLLEGTKANRSAIGTRIVAKIGTKSIERHVQGSQSYLSVSDLRVHFGLGDAAKIDELTIFWPGGEKQVLTDVTSGKYYFVKQDTASVEFVPGKLSKTP